MKRTHAATCTWTSPRLTVLLLAATTLNLAASGCSSDSGGGSAAADSGIPTEGEGEGTGTPDGGVAELVGAFQVTLHPPVAATESAPAVEGRTKLVGRVNNGPTPDLVVWEEALREGECVLSTPRVPFCSEVCPNDGACVEDETCREYPQVYDVGSLTVKGLQTLAGLTEFTLEPQKGNYQTTDCPYPAFAEGDPVRLELAGGAAGPFVLEAPGIAPLEVATGSIKLNAGQPLALTWDPPGPAGRSTIHIKLDLSHHGGSKGKVECIVADTGAFTLSATLVDRLLALGIAGFPSYVLTRRATDAVTLPPGRVELVISATEERFLELEGLVSCIDDKDCPSPQRCQADLTCK